MDLDIDSYARVQQAKMAWDQTSYVHIFGNCEQGLHGWVVTQSPFESSKTVGR
jgi:hypothetical protein